MPYNKGDFTQQGYDGKVSGGLLLNNKRDVDVLVSTNEDDSTLGVVAVTIEDHLNGLKYDFWGENLEAGEVYEIGGGGADFVNPKFTLDITDEITPQHSIAITDFILIQNNQLIPFLDGASGEAALTGVYEGYGVYNQEAETYYTVLTYEGEGLTIAYTIETENCTYEEDSNYIFFNVTDPTQDANVTVTFTAE